MTGRRPSPWLNDIPSVNKILSEALSKLNLIDCAHYVGGNGSYRTRCIDQLRRFLKSNGVFNAVTQIEKMCHRIYLDYENEVRKKMTSGKYGNVDTTVFETSLRNSRMSRAGLTLEKIISLIFEAMYERYSQLKSQKRTKNIIENVHYCNKEVEFDYVFPDRTSAIGDPRHSALISLKRNVRERWKLTVGDAYILRYKCSYPIYDNIWFVSLYEMPLEAIAAMPPLCIRVYVPEDIFRSICSRWDQEKGKCIQWGQDFERKIKRSKCANICDPMETYGGRIRPFSQLFDDLDKIVIKKIEKNNECNECLGKRVKGGVKGCILE